MTTINLSVNQKYHIKDGKEEIEIHVDTSGIKSENDKIEVFDYRSVGEAPVSIFADVYNDRIELDMTGSYNLFKLSDGEVKHICRIAGNAKTCKYLVDERVEKVYEEPNHTPLIGNVPYSWLGL